MAFPLPPPALFLTTGFPTGMMVGYRLSRNRTMSPFLFFMLTTLIFAAAYALLRSAGVRWYAEEGDMLAITLITAWYGLNVFQTLKWNDTPGWIFVRVLCFLPTIPMILASAWLSFCFIKLCFR